MIIEACQSEIDSENTIECTKEQFDLIQKQYDTIVKDWKIISQTEWQNAKKLEDIVDQTQIQENSVVS